jgi:hypothetical protein
VITNLMSELFFSKDPSLEDYWGGIILYGRNVASYKFALAKSLLELNPQAGQLIKLGELAPVFARFDVVLAALVRHGGDELQDSLLGGSFVPRCEGIVCVCN